MSQSLITDHCLIFLSSSVPQWTQFISPGWTKCSFKPFILPAMSPSVLFLTNCVYHCSNMTRCWGVWGCSERCNGSFQSIIAFPWKSQLHPSALLSISQSSSAPPLQAGIFVFFSPLSYHSILTHPLLPNSDPVLSLHSFFTILSLCWISLPASCFHLSLPQSLPHWCFMF